MPRHFCQSLLGPVSLLFPGEACTVWRLHQVDRGALVLKAFNDGPDLPLNLFVYEDSDFHMLFFRY